MPSRPSATPSAMAQTPAPTISTCCCASFSFDGGLVQRASRGMNPISSRISGAYSGVTFSPSVARIIFSISSSPGSVMAGFGSPFSNSFSTAAGVSAWISRRNPGLVIRNQANVALGLVGRLQPALIAGHVHQDHQQHADVTLRDGRRQIELPARYFDVHAHVLNYALGAS